MEIIIIVLSLSLVFFLLPLYSLRRRRRPFRNPPPSPRALPLLGHLHLLKKPLHQSLAQLSATHGPILFLRFGSRPVLHVPSASAAEDCFTHNDAAFGNRPRFLVGKHLGYNYTTKVWAPCGPHWRNLRRIAALEFFSRLDASSSLINREVAAMVDEVRAAATVAVGLVELRPRLFKLSLNLILKMVAGKGPARRPEELSEIVRESFELSGATNLGDFIPALRWFDYRGVERRLKRLQGKRDGFLQELVEGRRKVIGLSPENTGGRRCLIDELLGLQKSNPDQYTDEIIKGILVVMNSQARGRGSEQRKDKGKEKVRKDSMNRGVHFVDWKTVCSPQEHGGLGFHSSEAWQGPLRAKFAWELLNPGVSLFYQVLTARYGPRLFEGELKRADSPVLRIIRQGFASLTNIVRWRVASGASIDVLRHTWILELPIYRWPTFVNPSLPVHSSVADLLDESGSWNLSLLAQWFGPELMHLIAAVPVRRSCAQDWPELLRVLSGRTICSLAFDAQMEAGGGGFKWLQRLKLRPREKFFWWRLGHDALPTGCWLARRGLALEIGCPWGCPHVEDRLHLISNCRMLRDVGRALRRWGVAFPVISSWDELVSLFEKVAKAEIRAYQIFCYAVFQCWRARNLKVHHQEFATPTVMAANIIESCSIKLVFPGLGHWDTTQPAWLRISSAWCPLPLRWVKINFDGSLSSNRCLGIGVVARDEVGSVLFAGGRRRAHWDPGGAELAALSSLKDFILPSVVAAKGVIFECDCRNLVEMCSQGLLQDKWPAGFLDQADFSFLLELPQILFRYVPREANCVADLCARLAVVDEFLWLDELCASPDFLELVQKDREGCLPL